MSKERFIHNIETGEIITIDTNYKFIQANLLANRKVKKRKWYWDDEQNVQLDPNSLNKVLSRKQAELEEEIAKFERENAEFERLKANGGEGNKPNSKSKAKTGRPKSDDIIDDIDELIERTK